jgi:mevalonate kinase
MGKAFAKVILVGEHFVVPSTDSTGAVVPGSAAVAIPLTALHTEVRLSPAERVHCELSLSSTEPDSIGNAVELMEKAFRHAAARFQWDLERQPLRVSSNSNFPMSRGLGSSASFSVALVREFVRLSSRACDVRAEAQQLENIFHGKSSGLDTSTIAADAAILFQGGTVVSTFEPLAADIVVADSGPRDACSSLVSRTLELRKNKPDLWKGLAAQISELSHRCVLEFAKPTGTSELARIVSCAQEILTEIGLMNDQLAELLKIGHRAGALAGKLSGAGSGGVALFVAPRGEGQELAARMRQAGARVVTVA